MSRKPQTPSMKRDLFVRNLQENRQTKTQSTPDYLDLQIGWRFTLMEHQGSVSCDLKKLHEYEKELVKLEKMTRNIIESRPHNHPLNVSKLEPQQLESLNRLNIELGCVYQLDLRTPARLWGFWERNIFNIIWLDPDHKVYQGQRHQ